MFMICFWILVPKWLPKASAADTLLAPLFYVFATLFHKGVFEGSLARFGFPFGSNWLVSITFVAQFWYRKPFPFGQTLLFLHFIQKVGGVRRSL